MTGNQVYLVARYSRADELREIRLLLRSRGWNVQARWLDGDHQLTEGADVDAFSLRLAREDYEDVSNADIVVCFSEVPRKPSTNRGGRHVEKGIALALGKRVILVGPRENVFDYLPQVEQFDTWWTAEWVFRDPSREHHEGATE